MFPVSKMFLVHFMAGICYLVKFAVKSTKSIKLEQYAGTTANFRITEISFNLQVSHFSQG